MWMVGGVGGGDGGRCRCEDGGGVGVRMGEV